MTWNPEQFDIVIRMVPKEGENALDKEVQRGMITETISKSPDTELTVGQDDTILGRIVRKEVRQAHTNGPGLPKIVGAFTDASVKVNLIESNRSWILDQTARASRPRIGLSGAVSIEDSRANRDVRD